MEKKRRRISSNWDATLRTRIGTSCIEDYDDTSNWSVNQSEFVCLFSPYWPTACRFPWTLRLQSDVFNPHMAWIRWYQIRAWYWGLHASRASDRKNYFCYTTECRIQMIDRLDIDSRTKYTSASVQLASVHQYIPHNSNIFLLRIVNFYPPHRWDPAKETRPRVKIKLHSI